jgi:branched-chain amino acid transport system ATP-binding protein
VSLLSVNSLSVHHGLLQAVRDVNLQINEGETVALIGANGAGKTTLLRTIAGTHRPSAGRIELDGTDVTPVPPYDRVGMGIALVPEGRRLFSAMTVEENLKIAAAAAGRKGEWTIDRVMDAFPMLKPRFKARCGTLSGGEQQATAIGRALVTNPRILLLDEVSLGLSPLAVDLVYKSLEGLIASKATILLVEQDLKRALKVTTRVMCMLEGRVVLEGTSGSLTREQITDAYFGHQKQNKPVKTS